MTNDALTNAIMSAGMKCLVEKLGIVETEVFISVLRANTFDYTEWRQNNLWKDMTIKDILDLAETRERERKQ